MVQKTRIMVVASLAAVIAALVAASPIGQILERELGQYFLIRLRGPVEAPSGVVVVAQDYASAAALGLPNKLSGWPRRHLAKVIRQASSAGARAIVLDIFLDGSQSEEDDIALERAIEASGRVMLVERMRREAAAIEPDGPKIVEEQVLPPLPRFVAGAYATAPFPLPQGWWRVAAFWAFKAGAEGRATLPAAALLTAVFADPVARGALAAAAKAESMFAAADLITRAEVPFESQVGKLRQRFGLNSSMTRLVSRIESGTRDPSASQLAAAAVMLLAGPEVYLLVPYGPAGHVPRVSYHRVVAGEPDALALLRGQVVLVGASDLRNQAELDTFHTVFSHPDKIELSGVEIAATAYLNLLHGDAAHPASQIATALLAGGSAVAAAFTGMVLPSILGLVTIFAVAGAASAVSTAVLEAWHVALPLGSVLLVSLPIGLLAGRLSRHDFARRQLDQVVDILTRGRVRRADPLSGLEWAMRREERWAVCLATDLADYVRLTESMLARKPDLADLLAAYRGIVHGVVERHGGTVLEFVGDASMCMWEADAPSPEIRVRAVRAAMELVRELDHFAAARDLHGHRTRIGLAEGTILLGNLVEGSHFAFGGVGEPFNIASRLEQLNKQLGTQVLATAAVVRELDGLLARRIGPVSLKGKAQPEEVVVLELVA